MHLGARVAGYDGDPDGWVLEPMNLCVEPFFGHAQQSNKDWEDFGKSLEGAKVRVEGVPRIWPEHLIGGSRSNPDHAVEIHPMTRLQRGNHVYNFTSFIYAPDGFIGGVGEDTARKILTETEVTVTEDHGIVEVDFSSGRIGNFTIVDVSVDSDSIDEVDGGCLAAGVAVLGRSQKVPVTLVTVADTEINKTLQQLKRTKKNRRRTFEVLVLFSLSPEALYKAAKESHGKQIPVENPIQLIVYGQPYL